MLNHSVLKLFLTYPPLEAEQSSGPRNLVTTPSANSSILSSFFPTWIIFIQLSFTSYFSCGDTSAVTLLTTNGFKGFDGWRVSVLVFIFKLFFIHYTTQFFSVCWSVLHAVSQWQHKPQMKTKVKDCTLLMQKALHVAHSIVSFGWISHVVLIRALLVPTISVSGVLASCLSDRLLQ